MKLTDKFCATVKPEGDRQVFFDDHAAGLLFRVTTSSKTWGMQYRLTSWPKGKRGSMVLGKYPVLTLKAAREAVAVHAAQIAAGIDPKVEVEKPKGETVGDVVTIYRAKRLADRKTADEIERILKRAREAHRDGRDDLHRSCQSKLA